MSLLPPDFPKAIVAIGTKQEGKFVADSTGFIVNMKVSESDKKILLPKNFRSSIPENLLVTNRHVFDGRDEVVIKLNDRQQVTLKLKDLEGIIWTNHKDENVDIAVSFIPRLKSVDRATVAVAGEDIFVTSDEMKKEGVRIGDEVFVLGFPMGIAGMEENYPIVRSGVIARFDDEILKNHYYYTDVAIYGGNSGGPVILKPTHFSVTGTFRDKAYVIGVVSAVELQRQTLYGLGRGEPEPRMVLYEHANLGVVVPMEYVKEAVDYLKRRIDQRVPGTAEYNP